MSRDYRKLKVFQMSDDLALNIYKATEKFPRTEVYGLTQRMRRAAVSVPANIVEGCGRQTSKEYIQFLNIASGSLAELGYIVSLSFRLGYMNSEQKESLYDLYENCARAMNGLMKKLKD